MRAAVSGPARLVPLVALVGLVGLLVALVGGLVGLSGPAAAKPAPPTTTVPASTTTTVPPTLPDGSPDVQARGWILVDGTSGTVVTGAQEHLALPTASTVKMVTALTALRQLGVGGTVSVSEQAATRPAMRIGMVAGQQWSVLDSLWCLLLVSANDAAYALAETAGGSVSGFAAQMNETGRRLGLVESTFADPAGFDAAPDTEVGPSTMSAWDLAITARAVLADPVLAPMVATPRHDFAGPDGLAHTLPNHNKLLRADPTVIGVKTGWTKAAGGTFVAAAERDGRRLIGVVIGAPGDIYTPMNRLFDYGFALPGSGAGATVLPPVVDVTTPTTTLAPTTAAPTSVAPTTTAAPTSVAPSLSPTTVPATTTAVPMATTTAVPLATTTAVPMAPPAAGGPAGPSGAGGTGERDSAGALLDASATTSSADDPENAALNASAPPRPSTSARLSPWPWAAAGGAVAAGMVGGTWGRRRVVRRRRRRQRQAVERMLAEVAA